MKALMVVFGFFLTLFAGLANATSVYDPLTSAVSVTDIIAALFAVAAVVAALPVARSGIKAVLRALHF